jgi:hypothetical protein
MHNIYNNMLVIQHIKQNENAQTWIHIYKILQHHHNNYNATYQLTYFSIFPSNIYIMYFLYHAFVLDLSMFIFFWASNPYSHMHL